MSTQPSVCIIGAGAAGLTLAKTLAARSWKVTIVEGGHLDASTSYDSESRVAIVGTPHRGVDVGRFRGWGGSTTRWGGQLWAWEPYEFRERVPQGIQAWPIAFEEVASRTDAAFELVGLPHASLTPSEAVSLGVEPLGLNPAEFKLKYSTWLPWRKRNLGATVGSKLRSAPNVTVHAESTATHLLLDEAGRRVSGVLIRNKSGAESTLTADVVVVAAGAIETSRLLFLLDQPSSRSQTRWHWLGRAFMDHLSVRMARFRPNDLRQFARIFAPIFARGAQHTPRMLLQPSVLEHEGLLGCYGHWEVQSGPNSAFSILRETLRAFQSGKRSPLSLDELKKLVFGVSDLFRLASGVIISRRRYFDRGAEIFLRVDVEQRPDPESRLFPTGVFDSFGLPRVALDWHVSPLEQETALRAAARIGKELDRLNIGKLDIENDPFASGTPWGELKGDSFHMMGGTRMAGQPTDGVVDTNCKVFGIDNLFIASTSVFPTGGMANPTLLLICLTMRLADHLHRRAQ